MLNPKNTQYCPHQPLDRINGDGSPMRDQETRLNIEPKLINIGDTRRLLREAEGPDGETSPN